MERVQGLLDADPDLDEKALQTLAAVPADIAPEKRASLAARLLGNRDFALLLATVLLFIFFSLATDTFLREFNLLNILRNISLITVVAVGMTYVMVAGEIDLSVGAVYGFLTVVMGTLVATAGINPWLALPLIVLAGAAIGLVNAGFIVGVGIPSFIVTLAMLAGYRSLALVTSGEQPITVRGRELFYQVTGGDLFGHVPWLILWAIPVIAVGAAVLAYTRFGYHVYAIGGNREAARDSGIDVNRVLIWLFVLTGALCGLAAALVFGYLRTAGPTTGAGFEFRVIGAVVVGGTALTGGRGRVLGTLLGAMIIGIITSGMVLLGYSQNVGDIAVGLLIILVGALDLGLRARSNRGPHHNSTG